MWLYPDGSRILELSTRSDVNEAFQVAAEVRAYLANRGVDISGEQATKTRKALEFFAGTIRSRSDRPSLGVAHFRRDFGEADTRFGALVPERARKATRSTCSRPEATPPSRSGRA